MSANATARTDARARGRAALCMRAIDMWFHRQIPSNPIFEYLTSRYIES
jgi:hypothetical protein